MKKGILMITVMTTAMESHLGKECERLTARVEELEKAVDRYKVRDDQVMFALKRLREVLNDPPWGKI